MTTHVDYPFTDILSTFDTLTQMLVKPKDPKGISIGGELIIQDTTGRTHSLSLVQLSNFTRTLGNSHAVLRTTPIHFLVSQFLITDLKDIREFDYYSIQLDHHNEHVVLEVRIKPNDPLKEYKLSDFGIFNQVSLNYCVGNWLVKNQLLENDEVGGYGLSWKYVETSEEISFNLGSSV